MRINEYPKATSFDEGDILIKDGTNGTKGILFSDAASALLESVLSPMMHRNVYRGKYLGTSVTDAQKAAIQNGTFKDLYIGDYWTIGGKNWRIADINYFHNCGDTAFTKNHLVIVPEGILYAHRMNASNTTEGGYIGSEMRISGLDSAKATIESAFGNLVLTHRDHFTNAVTNGKASGGTWYDSKVELMNEIMVYGCPIFTPGCDGSTVPNLYTTAKKQLAIMKLNPNVIIAKRQDIWLRDVVSSAAFAAVHSDGTAGYSYASTSIGVLPYFVIGV